MGTDFIGWRDCGLQQELGDVALRRLIRLRQLHRLVVERVPLEERDEVALTEVHEDEELTWRWPQLCQAVEKLREDAPRCEGCPLSAGQAVGCWRPVAPVSVLAETLLFTWFSVARRREGSLVAALDADLISQVPKGTPWHHKRGLTGLCQLPEVLGDGERDSGQLLAALFWRPVDDPLWLQGLAAFWAGFADFVAHEASTYLDITAQAQGSQRGEERLDRSVRELLAVGSLVQQVAERGWTLR